MERVIGSSQYERETEKVNDYNKILVHAELFKV